MHNNGSAEASREDILDCLRNSPADQIVSMELGTAPPSVNFSPFVLTTDGDIIHGELTDNSFIKTLQQNQPDGSQQKLRVLMGTNADEGSKAAMYFMPRIFPNHQEIDPDRLLDQASFQDAITKMFPKETPKEVSINSN